MAQPIMQKPKKATKQQPEPTGTRPEWICCYCEIKRIGRRWGRVGSTRRMYCPICRQRMEHTRIV